jgi:hypothetical protein
VSIPAQRDSQANGNGTGSGQDGRYGIRPDVIPEIRAWNAEGRANEDQWARTRLATDRVRHAKDDARQADSAWANADLHHKTLQAEHPDRTAPRLRQYLVAAGILALDGVACYFAAEAVGGSPDETLAWALLFLALLGTGELMLDLNREVHKVLWRWTASMLGTFVALLGVLRFWFLAVVSEAGMVSAGVGAILFTLATASFVVVGYRALRAAETGPAWRARCQARRRAKDAAAAYRDVERLKCERDNLARAYLSRLRTRLVQTCSADQLPQAERTVWEHLTGEDQS